MTGGCGQATGKQNKIGNSEHSTIFKSKKEDRKIQIDSTLTVSDSVIFDLKRCIELFGYPPNIPTDIYWTKPSELKPEEAGEYGLFNTRYDFDKKNRLIVYCYQGSKILGIFPLVYGFKYVDDDSYLINEIFDPFYKEKYRIEYDSLKNIKLIEKLDSVNFTIERFTIEIKQ